MERIFILGNTVANSGTVAAVAGAAGALLLGAAVVDPKAPEVAGAGVALAVNPEAGAAGAFPPKLNPPVAGVGADAPVAGADAVGGFVVAGAPVASAAPKDGAAGAGAVPAGAVAPNEKPPPEEENPAGAPDDTPAPEAGAGAEAPKLNAMVEAATANDDVAMIQISDRNDGVEHARARPGASILGAQGLHDFLRRNS